MNAGDGENSRLPSMIEKLILVHRDRWLRYAERVVQDRADAEDVLQESVLKMLAHNRCFGSPDQARMYLGRIIANTAIEHYHLRRRDRKRCCPLHDPMLASAGFDGIPFPGAESEELYCAQVVRLLNEGLARLPAKQYEALQLTIMDPAAASMRDAGVEHDIPYSTLRHRKVAGLRRLRRFLQRALRSRSVPAFPS
jgi:RNA polymerase sigma factor (sigma-70 family)